MVLRGKYKIYPSSDAIKICKYGLHPCYFLLSQHHKVIFPDFKAVFSSIEYETGILIFSAMYFFTNNNRISWEILFNGMCD